MARSDRPRPVVLCILDGWGESSSDDHNAIRLADTPAWDGFMLAIEPGDHIKSVRFDA